MRTHIFVITVSAALLVVSSWAQDAHTVPVAAIGPELAYTEVLLPPMPVRAVSTPLRLSSESERSNYLAGSLQLGSAYDDNILSTPSHYIGNVSYLISPRLDIGQRRERWTWEFEYSPGFTINQRVLERNQASHDLYMLFNYRLSPHVTAQIRDNFQKTNSLVSGILRSQSGGPGPLQQPNMSGITPFANRTANTSGLDLSYQYSSSSLVGVSGDFYFTNYEAPTGTAAASYALIDSRSWGGYAYYAHRFSNRHWAGVTHNFERFLFNPGYRTDVNRTLLFYSLPLGSQVMLSVWVGPEFTQSVIPATPQLGAGGATHDKESVAAGGELLWQGRRTSARLTYSRETSDGGGLAESVHLQQFGGEIRERMTRRWTISATVGYARNNPLTVTNGTAPYRSWIGDAGLECGIRSNLTFSLRYGREQLKYDYTSLPDVWLNHNRAWASITYSFSRPLGR